MAEIATSCEGVNKEKNEIDSPQLCEDLSDVPAGGLPLLGVDGDWAPSGVGTPSLVPTIGPRLGF